LKQELEAYPAKTQSKFSEWNENKDREIPQKKDMFGVKQDKNNEQIIIENILTKKSGKPLVKDSKESQDFSKGKD